MKALKSISVQILLIGMLACTIQVIIIMYFGKRWQYDAGTVLALAQLVGGTFAGGFSGLVIARKGRDMVQSNKGQYFDEKEKTIKKVE